MSYFLASSGSAPTINFVLTSSYVNGPIISISASITATKPGNSLPWIYHTSSISQFNSLTLMGVTNTGSNVLPLIQVLSQSFNFNFVSASKEELRSFVTASTVTGAIVDLFASCSVGLT